MMRILTATTYALVLLLALPPLAAQEGTDDAKITKRRVVRVLSGSEPVIVESEIVGESEDFVFIGDDGEPLTIRSSFAFRGGYLGVQLLDLTPELRTHFGAPDDAGVMISAVSPDGPAAEAGLEVGDIVTALDGKSVRTSGQLARLVRAGEEGDVVELEILRNRRSELLEVVLGERERPQIDIGPMIWRHSDDEERAAHFEAHLGQLPEHIIHLDREHIDSALEGLEKHLESGEWQARLRAMVDERKRMEERVLELEERLRELEERLSRLD